MHPVVKITSLLILTIFSTQGEWGTLLVTISVILPFYIIHTKLWPPALQMIVRLKWLFFSILLIYFLFTPDVVFQESSKELINRYPAEEFLNYFYISPEIQSLINRILPALFRISVLILIVLSVNLFLKTSPIEQILAALLWLFHPLKALNINIERLSLRAVLTLEYIEVLTLRLAEYKIIKKENKLSCNNISFIECIKLFIKQRKEMLFHLIKYSGIIFHEILNETQLVSEKKYTIICLETPPFLQILIPIILCLFYIFNPFLTFI